MKLFRKVITITLVWISFLYNQVNTEDMRSNNLLPGVHHKLELDFAYISGNTEILNLNGVYHADFVSNSNCYYLMLCFCGHFDYSISISSQTHSVILGMNFRVHSHTFRYLSGTRDLHSGHWKNLRSSHSA